MDCSLIQSQCREGGSSSSSEEEERPPSPRKTRSTGSGAQQEQEQEQEPILEKVVQEPSKEEQEEVVVKENDKEVVKVEVKNEVKKEEVVEPEEIRVSVKEEVKKLEEKVAEAKPSRTTSNKLEILIPKEDIKEEEANRSTSPLKSPDCLASPSASKLLKSPGKPALGLPDQSGLVVGVNTINYDVSFRNKTKTREEKKMEMILKAISDMERAEARKKSEGGDSSGDVPQKKRRRSNSIKNSNKNELNSVDSNLDASSADESGGPKLPAQKKLRGKRSGGLGSRRRSRAKSGDSSNISGDEKEEADEVAQEQEQEREREFKFPRHKRHAMAKEEGDVDDDVSKQYLRGSRSPPGIANHLLRSSGSTKVG